MFVDFILATAHHLTMLFLVMLLFTQIVLVQAPMDAARIGRSAALDRAYGGLALLMLAFGFARVFFSLKDPSFYVSNPVFWAKIGAFVLVGLLSIRPTLLFLRWARMSASDTAFQPPANETDSVRRFLRLEAIVFMTIPILAAAMARGIGI